MIYIIAGPPAIGKSTSASYFIPEGITILDSDKIAQTYRAQGFANYKDIGNLKFDSLVGRELFSGRDFAIELNLGFQTHYDYVRNLKNLKPASSIKLVLFHTDDKDLCLQRARIRHEHGLHLVTPETIDEMYSNTIPLLKENLSLISSIRAVNVTRTEHPTPCLDYNINGQNELKFSEQLPKWIKNDLLTLLQSISQEKSHEQEQKLPHRQTRRPRF